MAKKTVCRGLTDLAHDSSDWSVFTGKLGIWMCISLALHERTTTLHWLYYLLLENELVIMNIIFVLDNEIDYWLIYVLKCFLQTPKDITPL